MATIDTTIFEIVDGGLLKPSPPPTRIRFSKYPGSDMVKQRHTKKKDSNI